MQIKFLKLNPEATIPMRGSDFAAGFDLRAISYNITENFVEYDTGIAMEIPEGHVGLLYPRSSVSKKNLVLANSVGVIDSDYRGPVKLRFKPAGPIDPYTMYNVGDAVGQIIIMPIPAIEFQEVTELSTTVRAEGGFGSTDKK